MKKVKEVVESAKQSPIEYHDATELSPEQVLAQIEASMQSMDESSQRRVVFTNDGETFEERIDKL